LGTAAPARADDELFTLRSSDLTGPVEVAAGQVVWRTAAIRNTSEQYRLTIGLMGSGEHPDWVQPAVEQVELAPGQQQLVRFSVTPPSAADGVTDLGLTATLLEARSVLIVGKSPVATTQRRELAFRIEVTAPDASTPATESEATVVEETVSAAPDIDLGRIAGALLALAVILGVLWKAPRRGRRRQERVEVVALDIGRLNQALDERRARDGLDDRSASLSAR
jgi:hypothetical protein